MLMQIIISSSVKFSIVAVSEVVIVLVALFLNANLGSNMRIPEQINYSGLNCELSIFCLGFFILSFQAQ